MEKYSDAATVSDESNGVKTYQIPITAVLDSLVEVKEFESEADLTDEDVEQAMIEAIQEGQARVSEMRVRD